MKMKVKDFKCLKCGKLVVSYHNIGTSHRNHCPYCLWSKHVDFYHVGDRKATCGASMEPVGLTFKKSKPDKYKKEEKGEIMVISRCLSCGKISLNRIAGDDDPDAILSILEKSKHLDASTLKTLLENDVDLATEKDLTEIKTQLFGKS